MRATSISIRASLVLSLALLAACGASEHGEPPQKVAGTTIEQAMGIKPKPVELKASQRIAARPSARQQTTPAPAQPAAKKLAAVKPDAPKLARRSTSETVPQMPASPVRKVESKPLPVSANAGEVRVALQSRNAQTGTRTFAIASDAVVEEEMIRIIPYLPALFAEGTRMTGFAYVNGSIVLADHCPDDPGQWEGDCPSYLSTIEVIPDFGDGGRDDFIPVAAAIDLLRDFERKMKRRLGVFSYVVCGEPLDKCVAGGG